MDKVYIVGKDKRQENLRVYYKEKLVRNIEEANVVVLPIPVTKDGEYITLSDIKLKDITENIKNKIVVGGKFPKELVDNFEKNNIKYYDLMDMEELTILNAIPTAEGTIAKAMEIMEKTLFESNVLILGFGKCGKIIADRMQGLRANVFCEARKEKDIAQIRAMGYNYVELANIDKALPKMDLVINTVPYMLLNRERIDLLKNGAVIIDIASFPGGTDFEYCKEKNITAVLELGIPAKVAPVSASQYIKEIIDKII